MRGVSVSNEIYICNKHFTYPTWTVVWTPTPYISPKRLESFRTFYSLRGGLSRTRSYVSGASYLIVSVPCCKSHYIFLKNTVEEFESIADVSPKAPQNDVINTESLLVISHIKDVEFLVNCNFSNSTKNV